MAKVVIGGEPIEATLPSFRELKAAWPFVAQAQAARGGADLADGVDAVLAIIAVGQVGADGPDEALSAEIIADEVKKLERRLRPNELGNLTPFVNALLVECGLAKKAEDATGEPAPAGTTDASPSPATSTV